jgi:ribokinase
MRGGPRVVVIGDALLDVIARPLIAVRVGGDVPADVRIGPGGQGANLAVRLARLGVSVELVCAIGDDSAGALLTRTLRDERVDLSPVIVESTGTVVIEVGDDGERTMMSQRAGFAAAAVEAVGRIEAEWTVLSGYLFSEADAGLLARAVSSNATRRVVVGCAVPADMVAAWRRTVAGARADLVVLNREEASAVAPVEALADGIVVTGRDRVTASVGDATVDVALDRGPAVDSTGAGDAFAAALVAGLTRVAWPPERRSLASAIEAAVALAGEVASVPGAQATVEAESQP